MVLLGATADATGGFLQHTDRRGEDTTGQDRTGLQERTGKDRRGEERIKCNGPPKICDVICGLLGAQ